MKMEVSGLDELIKNLDALEHETEGLFKRAMYKGAAIVADEIKKGLNGMRTQEFVKKGEMRKGIRERYKADLIESFGISKMESSGGSVNISIGFHGYGHHPTPTYPNGIPNQMLMRAVESGTSFMQKQPIVRQAVNRVKKRAEETMKLEVIDTIRKGI